MKLTISDVHFKDGVEDVFIPYPFREQVFDGSAHRARRWIVRALYNTYRVEEMRRAFFPANRMCALFLTIRPDPDGPPVEYWINYSPLRAMRKRRGERIVQQVTREDVMESELAL